MKREVKKFPFGITGAAQNATHGSSADGGGCCDLIISILALLELPAWDLFIGVLSFQSARRGSPMSFVRG